MQFVADHRLGVATRGSWDLMHYGGSSAALLALALVGAVIVVVGRHWRLGAAVGLAFIVAKVVAPALKANIGRPRPPGWVSLVHLQGASFPSDHAALTAAVATAAVCTADWFGRWSRRALAIVLSGAVLIVGVAMVYLGGHWPSDVLAGWGLGIAIGWLAARLVRGIPNRPARIARRDCAHP